MSHQIDGLAIKASADKEETAGYISSILGLPAPVMSSGSTVLADLLDEMLQHLGLSTGGNVYRRYERLTQHYGLEYEKAPNGDTSEGSRSGGGGTVTARGYRKLLNAVLGTPCFIFTQSDVPHSKKYRDIPGQRYGFDANVSGRVQLLEAGVGTRVVFYRSMKSPVKPSGVFFAHATVRSIQEVEPGVWQALLCDYEEFERPVRSADVSIRDWNRIVPIVQITPSTFEALCERGLPSVGSTAGSGGILEDDESAPEPSIPEPMDSPTTVGSYVGASQMPTALPSGALEVVVGSPTLGDRALSQDAASRRRSSKANQRELDKQTEEAAVAVAATYLHDNGYTLHRDTQTRGVGYDFEYRNDEEVLHVEVKGIRGSAVVFNMTNLEFARALEDEQFVVIAVTSALIPAERRVHFITRDQIVGAAIRCLEYRVTIPSSKSA